MDAHGDRLIPPPHRFQRLFDRTVVVALAIPAAVLGAVSAVLVKATSPGPVVFRQTRVGRDGAEFELLKLRTMVAGDNPIFPDESRITAVGAVLRRSSLDELPQLVNVWRGDMSIVGPRPTLAYQVERYDDRQRGRLAVRPGLTGLAQVEGRNALTWAERIEMDLDYIERRSLRLDLHLLVRSLAVVVRGGGATGHPADDPLSRIEPAPPETEADQLPRAS